MWGLTMQKQISVMPADSLRYFRCVAMCFNEISTRYIPQSKKGNKKAKQTSEKLPHFRPEDRSRRKGSSVTAKKSKVRLLCCHVLQSPHCQLLKPLSWCWPQSGAKHFCCPAMLWFYAPAQTAVLSAVLHEGNGEDIPEVPFQLRQCPIYPHRNPF